MSDNNLIKDDLFPLLKLAIPMVITGLIQSSLYFFETVFLSQLGNDALAAGALVGWLFAALIVILFGTFGAVNILIAHKFGAKDKEAIAMVLRDGLLLAILLTIPTFLLFRNIASIFLLFGQSNELVALAKIYLNALSWGLFPKFIQIVLFEFLLGLGHSRTTMLVTIFTTPFYIAFSYILIFGKFGLPALGIAGAGWGMTAGDWVITCMLCLFIVTSKAYKPFIAAIFSFKKPSYIMEIVHLGLPIGVMYSLEVGFFLAASLIMGALGVAELAACQVAMQYLGLLMGVIFSIAQAVTVRMGHQLGAREFNRVKRTALTGVWISGLFMGMVAIFYWTQPQLLIAVDFNLKNPELFQTIQLATHFFFISGFFHIFESIRIALFGALRALKDTRFTLIASLISYWGIALPLGYSLANYSFMRGNGVWWAMVVGAAFSVVLLSLRFKQKMHQYIR